MATKANIPPTIFTESSAYSLAFVAFVGVAAYISSKALLPKNARWQDKAAWIWLVGTFLLVFFW